MFLVFFVVLLEAEPRTSLNYLNFDAVRQDSRLLSRTRLDHKVGGGSTLECWQLFWFFYSPVLLVWLVILVSKSPLFVVFVCCRWLAIFSSMIFFIDCSNGTELGALRAAKLPAWSVVGALLSRTPIFYPHAFVGNPKFPRQFPFLRLCPLIYRLYCCTSRK